MLQTTEVPDVWEHDLFQDDRPARGGGGRSFGAQKSAKLIVTNLDYGVNDQDIRVRIFHLIFMLQICITTFDTNNERHNNIVCTFLFHCKAIIFEAMSDHTKQGEVDFWYK